MTETESKTGVCKECGMPLPITSDLVSANHPYAACLMFKACRDAEIVQANLDAMVAHGYWLASEDRNDINTMYYALQIDTNNFQFAHHSKTEKEFLNKINKAYLEWASTKSGRSKPTMNQFMHGKQFVTINIAKISLALK